MSYDTMTVDEFHALFRGRPAFTEMCEWIGEHIGEDRYARTIRLGEGVVEFECVAYINVGGGRIRVQETSKGDPDWTWVVVPSHRPPPHWK